MTISSLFRFTFKKAGAIVALAAIMACSPSYNWRELDVADGHVRAAFPDTVKTETRDTRVDTMTMPVTMASAKVGDGMFAVVSAPLPAEIAASPGASRGLGVAAMRSLYLNLQVQPPLEFPPYGQDIEIRGQSGGQPFWMLARVWVTDTMLIEAIAAGSEKGLPRERAREFLDSVVLKKTP